MTSDDHLAKQLLLASVRPHQDTLCSRLQELDGSACFSRDFWESRLGSGETRILTGGAVFEKVGVAYSAVTGSHLPQAASERRPHLAGKPFQAAGVSLVAHPSNPHVPASHLNVRGFVVEDEGETRWWIGGGFDLTPCYGYEDDCRTWHECAKRALDGFDPSLYPEFKENCDRYFSLPHRNETRGIGGIFFDDFRPGPPGVAAALLRAVVEAFAEGYTTIVRRRSDQPFSEKQREFQLLRRGRYVEFNLLYDRGTLFGLQSGGRTESILLSLPPLVRWTYGASFPPGSPEAGFPARFLQPRDWLATPPYP